MKNKKKVWKVPFFIFLDTSGILLGLFLIGLGSAVILGWSISEWMGWILFVIGILAFLLHTGHYFNLRYMRWLFGDNYFLQE